MKKTIKILLFIIFALIAPVVVMIAVFDWHPFLVGGILFVSLVTFTPLKNPKPTPKFDLNKHYIVMKGLF